KGVLDPHDRLDKERYSGSGIAGWLSLNRQPARKRTIHNERAAYSIAQSTATGRQLFGSCRINSQIRECCESVSCVRANVRRSAALQRSSATAEGDDHCPVRRETDGRVISILVLRSD